MSEEECARLAKFLIIRAFQQLQCPQVSLGLPGFISYPVPRYSRLAFSSSPSDSHNLSAGHNIKQFLTAHPVVRGVDFDILPSSRRQASGFVPPPGKRPPPTSSSFSGSVNDPPRISQPPAIPARENMVNNTIGNLPLLNGWLG